jgi:hypothetical protein
MGKVGEEKAAALIGLEVREGDEEANPKATANSVARLPAG